ncbi:antibiotic biosynthesis monooxygenase [Amycolatopsis acidicola]|uniref:Antibiotic biosynthesis monooxygenase n=1 Tax=Amycolatopsis acidicola TaxID=2596893 RepID=A0A5N0VLW0_9PSEU|nr:putative quinol monooxygenase [Amycolatopsis acidicola]KAA9165601.1 antibiotic biosynthesis monooxygenase [Amycolatopsis acidicola]
MSDGSLVVVATIEAAEGNEEKVEQALRNAVRAVHAEPGCLRYALHRDAANPRTFVMVEKWASADALRTHSKAPALAELGKTLKGLLTKPLDVRTLAALPDGEDGQGAI